MENLKVIDVHTHLWQAHGYTADEDALLRAIDRYGISRIHVSALGGYRPTPEDVTEMNDATARFHRAHPESVSGYVYISPEHPNALEVLRRGIEEQGMEGVKFWVSTFCDDPCTYPLVEPCPQIPTLFAPERMESRSITPYPPVRHSPAAGRACAHPPRSPRRSCGSFRHRRRWMYPG